MLCIGLMQTTVERLTTKKQSGSLNAYLTARSSLLCIDLIWYILSWDFQQTKLLFFVFLLEITKFATFTIFLHCTMLLSIEIRERKNCKKEMAGFCSFLNQILLFWFVLLWNCKYLDISDPKKCFSFAKKKNSLTDKIEIFLTCGWSPPLELVFVSGANYC